MAKRKGSPTSREGTSSQRESGGMDERDAREVENAQRLDKLPQELWDKILDELKSNDLFPLALSCRYFRQKQKELVARTGQSGPESGEPALALRTDFRRKYFEHQPASADYLRFCSKEKVPSEGAPMRAKWIMYLVGYHDYLPLLQELQDELEEFELDTDAFSGASTGGNLEIMKWLRSVGCPWDARVCAGAAISGHLEILKWLRSEGCPWDAHACTYAAEGGYLEVLKWLRSQDPPCPWDEETCARAAMNGHLEILKWLRSEDCPWDMRTCTFAAQRGHLDVEKWAIDNGCPLGVISFTHT